MSIPKVIIAGTNSGVGKTLVSLAVMSGFKNNGYRVQAYKIGPDYIDPGYHRWITGRPSHNLDEWMMGAEAVGWLFHKNSQDCDIAVIEGVMGLFDGFSSVDDGGSTASVAKLLKIPIILVVDASKMARSVAAIIKGYQTLDLDVHICGVVLNRVASQHHFNMLKEAVEFYNKIPVVGALFQNKELAIPERHLGLKTVSENTEFQRLTAQLGSWTDFHGSEDSPGIHLKKIYDLANIYSQKDFYSGKTNFSLDAEQNVKQKIRIAYALDCAFQFYYQANLDFLESCQAELVPFSPLKDDRLPEDISGLYLGGGFPEVYAPEIEENQSMRQAVRGAIEGGLPTYAECGGLIYLAQSVKTLEGKTHLMAGVIPGEIEMTPRLVHFGYCENELLADCFLGPRGAQFRGHEFHYSRWNAENRSPIHRVKKKKAR